jgi:nucleoside-diphosphate-sugar epimerase
MRVLVFGASGFIGKCAVRSLIDHRHQVTGFVRSQSAAESVRGLGADAVVGSLDDSTQIHGALAASDAAIWLVQLALEEEKRVVEGLLRQLRRSAKTFIFTGGASVLSEPTGGEWSENTFAETDSFVPRRQLRVRAETEIVVRVAAQYGIRSMVVRPPLVYGHGGCRVISDLYHSLRETGSVCYIGRGLNTYSSVHVDDLANLFVLAIERGTAGALYHCVGGEATFRAMAEAIARGVGAATRSITVEQGEGIWDPFTATTVFSSCSRTRSPVARRDLGWKPSVDRADILEECLHPAYASESSRTLASWIKPTSVSGSGA